MCRAGGIALDPHHFPTNNDTLLEEAWALHNSCVAVGKEVVNLQPNVVVISTPHGIADLNAFLFYLSDHGYGTTDTDNCQCPPCCYSVNVALDFDLSTKLVSGLKVLCFGSHFLVWISAVLFCFVCFCLVCKVPYILQ